jgi:hypothetical protein
MTIIGGGALGLEQSHLFLDDYSTNHKIRWNQEFPISHEQLALEYYGESVPKVSTSSSRVEE